MGFTSQLYPNELVIDDSTPLSALLPPDHGQLDDDGAPSGRGLVLPFNHSAEGGNYGDLASAFPPELLIPESEFEARIKEKEELKNRISDWCFHYKLLHKDQNGTNYCWINAPVHCVEIIRLQANQKTVSLSPASCGAPIKNFRNNGGWGKEGLQYIAQHGVVPSTNWPDNAIERKYWTEENKKLALDYRITEWTELRPRNMQQLASLLLRNIPVALGYNWWSHEVTGADAVWINGKLAIRIRNSWKGYGDFGFAVLQGSKMAADDQVAPRVAIAA